MNIPNIIIRDGAYYARLDRDDDWGVVAVIVTLVALGGTLGWFARGWVL